MSFKPLASRPDRQCTLLGDPPPPTPELRGDGCAASEPRPLCPRIGDRPETVLRTYAHLLPQSDVQAAKQVAALVAAAGR
jgi:hypothetical protein